MKNVSRTIKVVILPVLAVALVFTFRAVAAKPPDIQAPFVLNCNERELKKDDGAVEFEKVLNKESHIYCMKYHKKGDAPAKDKHFNKKCPDATGSASSESVKNSEYTLICFGAHVTQQAGFMTAAGKKAVEDLLK